MFSSLPGKITVVYSVLLVTKIFKGMVSAFFTKEGWDGHIPEADGHC